MTVYKRELLFGRWIGNSYDQQGNEMIEHAHFFADGSFEFCFMTHDEQGYLVEQVIEMGDWGLVGDIHFTVTKNELIDENIYAADLANEDNYHAYKVIQLSPDSFKYQHIITEESFILKRVIDNIGHC